jgi:hypothetical protein
MTDEEINRAVAESVGWKWFDHPDVRERTKTFTLPDKWVEKPDGELVFPHAVPDYCNSYDAIMPLVKALRKGKENRFIHALGIDVLKICPLAGDVWMAQEYDCHQMLTATPRQLCEAYLAVGGADA